MARIGFVGLGNMGGPMAENLVKAGHQVQGFDLAPALLEASVAAGVVPARTASDVARQAEVVITMLPAGHAVLQAYKGSDGLLAAASPGSLFIDCSTINIADARAAHAAARQANIASIDAPVSGGVGGAAAATLTFMVGGDLEAFARSEPLLAAMGRNIIHCGGAGAGQAAKVCNNMILGISMIAVSEAFVLGEALGLSHKALFEVASTSSGQCWSLTTYCPVPGPVATSPANNGYKAGFAVALMLKDLNLARSAAVAGGVDSVLGDGAAAIYARLNDEGEGGSDFSAVINAIRSRSGGASNG